MAQLGICSGEVLSFQRGQPLEAHQFTLRICALRQPDLSLDGAVRAEVVASVNESAAALYEAVRDACGLPGQDRGLVKASVSAVDEVEIAQGIVGHVQIVVPVLIGIERERGFCLFLLLVTLPFLCLAFPILFALLLFQFPLYRLFLRFQLLVLGAAAKGVSTSNSQCLRHLSVGGLSQPGIMRTRAHALSIP